MRRSGVRFFVAAPFIFPALNGKEINVRKHGSGYCRVIKSFLVGYPSGQRDQTVNLTAMPSKVRILPPPPINEG